MKLWPDVIQGSEDWFALRELRPTASNAKKVITATGKDSASWKPYIYEMTDAKIRPRGVREATAFAGNAHTDRGKELEPLARNEFTKIMGLAAAEVGFVTRDDKVWGCSPDGLVLCPKTNDVVAGLEIKCPDGPKHQAHLDGGVLPADYIQQVHASMVVTGLNHWYFVSYCPYYETFILRVDRDGYTAKVEDAMDRFQTFYKAERPRLMKFKGNAPEVIPAPQPEPETADLL
ncbi:YqaJ viral recombinase family protein [Luteolibacter pohnpeiensis]|uniref:YqaJ viral recombinase family protein n=1 Tax=Luteolibacter pohnpeiensis TaxID=454153 RepID=A0A934VXR8_9BACT|nr:lambda exonuclease family protein [Luteolibacter pohnpeiensis]MBK1884660.1 YqaJ viral recombinase family protein [Luteolibacter pohnpeiensis]